MTDRPIIFSAPMVRALLDGRKSMTRRVLKPQPELNSAGLWRLPPFSQKITRRNWKGFCQTDEDGLRDFILTTRHRPYDIGQRLWVREAWRAMDGQDGFTGAQIEARCREAGYRRAWSPIRYEADGTRENWIADPHTFGTKPGRYRHARFMPRWASRLTLIVTDVRVQRVQEISNKDAIAEGIEPQGHAFTGYGRQKDVLMAPYDSFASLWNSLHGPDAWDRNDWVAAITFTVHHHNIDQMEAK